MLRTLKIIIEPSPAADLTHKRELPDIAELSRRTYLLIFTSEKITMKRLRW